MKLSLLDQIVEEAKRLNMPSSALETAIGALSQGREITDPLITNIFAQVSTPTLVLIGALGL